MVSTLAPIGCVQSGVNVAWRGAATFRTSLSEAERLKKPLLALFSADLGQSGRDFLESTYTDHEVVEILNRQFIPIRIDIEARPELTRQYGDQPLPRTLIFAGDGELLTEILMGIAEGEDFHVEYRSRLRQIAKAYPSFLQLKASARDNTVGLPLREALLRVYVELGAVKQAATLARTLESDARAPSVLATIHFVLGVTSEIGSSIDHFERALASDPRNESGLLERILWCKMRASERLGDRGKAVAICREAIERFPESHDLDAWLYREVRNLMSLENYAGAVAAIAEVKISLGSSLYASWIRDLARTAERLAEITGRIAEARRADDCEGMVKAQRALLSAYADYGHWESASSLLDTLTTKGLKEPKLATRVYLELALKEANSKKRLGLLERSIEADPTNTSGLLDSALNCKVAALISLGATDEAIATASIAIVKFPDSPIQSQLWLQKAEAHFILAQYDEVLLAAQTGLEKDPESQYRFAFIRLMRDARSRKRPLH